MAERREFEQRYASFWRKLIHFLYKNTGLSIGGIARTGSRRVGDHDADSDLDLIFFIPNNPQKNQIYPDLVVKLQKIFKVQAWIGKDYNVIDIRKNGLKINLVLLTEREFRSEVAHYQLITY